MLGKGNLRAPLKTANSMHYLDHDSIWYDHYIASCLLAANSISHEISVHIVHLVFTSPHNWTQTLRSCRGTMSFPPSILHRHDSKYIVVISIKVGDQASERVPLFSDVWEGLAKYTIEFSSFITRLLRSLLPQVVWLTPRSGKKGSQWNQAPSFKKDETRYGTWRVVAMFVISQPCLEWFVHRIFVTGAYPEKWLVYFHLC